MPTIADINKLNNILDGAKEFDFNGAKEIDTAFNLLREAVAGELGGTTTTTFPGDTQLGPKGEEALMAFKVFARGKKDYSRLKILQP